LARFPLEADIAPHFTVIDERTASELMNDAQNNVLELSYKKKNSAIAKAMHHLAELVNEEGFAKLMRELTGAKASLSHVLTAYGDGLDDAITEMVGLDKSEATIEKIILTACADNAFDNAGLSRAAIALSHGAAGSKKMGGALSGWLKAGAKERANNFLSIYAPLFIKKDGGAKAEKTLITKGADEHDPGALDILLTEQTRIMEVLEKIKCAQTANATRALLAVGHTIQKEYEKLKRSSGVLDYDDLIEKACGLLGNESSASWVHFKLDGGIDHILVDESQDTSPAQWIVVKGLAGDFFSGRGRAEENTRTVFAVGDEKQSIYSFQGADPYEFGRMSEYFEKRVTDAGAEFTPLQLITSFRSTNAVLKTVDMVFDNPVAFDGLSFKDEKVLHKSHRTGEAGLVELWQPQLPDNAVDADPWDAPLDRLSFKSPETKLAERIATTIKGWFDNKEILKSKGRPIRPDDILILVRRRGPFADEMIRQLKLNEVEVAGSDRMVLTDQIAVEDLMALGNFCLLPEDDLNTAGLLKSPLIGINEEQL
ncbi:MAG: UvrD-helicase domain-containing protein, partial [Rhodospirillaceae bacterium]|nr:UvrD-helicase domain-containing protein [Rhodospirillaceae bacterium]